MRIVSINSTRDYHKIHNVVPAVDQDGHREAMAVRWIPIDELTAMRESLFEDHGMIVSKLLQAQEKAMSWSR